MLWSEMPSTSASANSQVNDAPVNAPLRKPNLTTLPTEVLLKIASHLPTSAVRDLGLVHSSMRVLNETEIWRELPLCLSLHWGERPAVYHPSNRRRDRYRVELGWKREDELAWRAENVLWGVDQGLVGFERFRNVRKLTIEPIPKAAETIIEVLRTARLYLKEIVLVRTKIEYGTASGCPFWRGLIQLNEDGETCDAVERLDISCSQSTRPDPISHLLALCPNVKSVRINCTGGSWNTWLPMPGGNTDRRLVNPDLWCACTACQNVRPVLAPDNNIGATKQKVAKPVRFPKLVDLEIEFGRHDAWCCFSSAIRTLLLTARTVTLRARYGVSYDRLPFQILLERRAIMMPHVQRINLDLPGSYAIATATVPMMPMIGFEGKPEAASSIPVLVVTDRAKRWTQVERLESVILPAFWPVDTLIVQNNRGIKVLRPFTGSVAQPDHFSSVESRLVHLIPTPTVEGLERNPKLSTVQFVPANDTPQEPVVVPPQEWETAGTYGVTIRSLVHQHETLYHMRTYSPSVRPHKRTIPSVEQVLASYLSPNYRNDAGVVQQVWFTRREEAIWEDATYYDGAVVPLEIIDEMRKAAGDPAEPWEGRGAQMGEAAWKVLTDWKEKTYPDRQ